MNEILPSQINGDATTCRKYCIPSPSHAKYGWSRIDLRLTADDQIVVHHDHIVSIPEELFEDRSRIVEEWTLDELEKVGFCSFEKLMADKDWLIPWQEHSKVACLEIKRCLPEIDKDPTNRMARIMELASEMVDEAGIHEEAAVFYAFHKPMNKVAKLSGSNRPWSRLLPVAPRTGSQFKED